MRTPTLWREATSRRKKLYSWAGLSAVMVVIVLITTFGARPGPLQMLLLALVGVVMSGIAVLLIEWESASGGDAGDT